jgi:hypothetical protein
VHKGVGLGQQWCKIKFILLLNVWGIQSLSQYVSDYRYYLSFGIQAGINHSKEILSLHKSAKIIKFIYIFSDILENVLTALHEYMHSGSATLKFTPCMSLIICRQMSQNDR